MASVGSIFAAMAERRNTQLLEEKEQQEAMLEEEEYAEADIDEEVDEEVDEELEEAIDAAIEFLESNGYEVDEESIEAVLADWANEEEEEPEDDEPVDEELEEAIMAAAQWLEANGYEVDEESIEAVLNDWAMDEEEEPEQEEEIEEAKKCPECGEDPCKCKKDKKCEDEESEDTDIEEQGGGANIATSAPGSNCSKFDGDGKDKAPTSGSAAATDKTPSKPALTEKGKGWSSNTADTANHTNHNMKYAEETESEEAEISEDVAELQCRLEECQGSKFMFEMLAEGKTDMVKRYLEIKES